MKQRLKTHALSAAGQRSAVCEAKPDAREGQADQGESARARRGGRNVRQDQYRQLDVALGQAAYKTSEQERGLQK